MISVKSLPTHKIQRLVPRRITFLPESWPVPAIVGGRGACRRDLSRRGPSRGGRTHDAAEPDVAGRGVRRLELAGRGAVAQAVAGCAEVRAALDDEATR